MYVTNYFIYDYIFHVLGHNDGDLAEDMAHLELGDQAEGIQAEMDRRATPPNGIEYYVLVYKMQFSKTFLSETTRPRAFILHK